MKIDKYEAQELINCLGGDRLGEAASNPAVAAIGTHYPQNDMATAYAFAAGEIVSRLKQLEEDSENVPKPIQDIVDTMEEMAKAGDTQKLIQFAYETSWKAYRYGYYQAIADSEGID